MLPRFCAAGLALAIGTARAHSLLAHPQVCPLRPSPNMVVKNPPDLFSVHGILQLGLTLRSQEMAELPVKICYAFETDTATSESPTLRLDPGDTLDLALINRLAFVPKAERPPPNSPAPHDPCGGGIISSTATNLAFDGLALPAACHQGETTQTTIENTDDAFPYHFRIPANAPPGLDLYRPGLMGSAALQGEGGASGLLIIGGIEKARPEVAGLPERILVFRRQFDEPDTPDDATWISLNYQPVGYRHLPPPVIPMKPGAREFWRVANATPDTFLALQLVYGREAQPVRLVALDGVPTRAESGIETIALPPGGRAEFIVTGPALGQDARLMQSAFDTGPAGPEQPAEQLAKLATSRDAVVPPPVTPMAAPLAWSPRDIQALAAREGAVRRQLYFAEAALGTHGPTRFLITVAGQKPHVFDPSAPASIMTHVGALEDWIVANHSGEAHAFHARGLRFLLLAENGRRVADPEFRDTVTLPAWDGEGAFPTVTLRTDFSGPNAAGTHIVECGNTRHAEAGMMARLQVNPF